MDKDQIVALVEATLRSIPQATVSKFRSSMTVTIGDVRTYFQIREEKVKPPPTSFTLKCHRVGCENTFIAKHPSRSCCSEECRVLQRKAYDLAHPKPTASRTLAPLVKKQCENVLHCSKEFWTRMPYQRFCCRPCMRRASYEKDLATPGFKAWKAQTQKEYRAGIANSPKNVIKKIKKRIKYRSISVAKKAVHNAEIRASVQAALNLGLVEPPRTPEGMPRAFNISEMADVHKAVQSILREEK